MEEENYPEYKKHYMSSLMNNMNKAFERRKHRYSCRSFAPILFHHFMVYVVLTNICNRFYIKLLENGLEEKFVNEFSKFMTSDELLMANADLQQFLLYRLGKFYNLIENDILKYKEEDSLSSYLYFGLSGDSPYNIPNSTFMSLLEDSINI